MAATDTWLAGLRSAISGLTGRVAALEAEDRGVGSVQALVFTSLPTAGTAGRVRFCTDCLKDGETPGNGTGCPVYDDGVAWRRYSDDTSAGV